MRWDFLFTKNFDISLVDCEIVEQGLRAEISRFNAEVKAGIYDLGDTTIKPCLQIETPEMFCLKTSFPIEEPVIYRLIKIHE